jgi:phospho-N-acetylmuramoyl-pentapeptide-transferase
VLLVIQTSLAFLIAFLLYFNLGINNINIPAIGNFVIGAMYIPMAAFIIVSFANAYNISDGLDGLSSGLLLICLFAFLVLASSVFDETLSAFVGIWIGVLIAYLYFNVFPARIYLGDAGAFGFGATLAVVGLLTGKIVGLAVIGGVYIIIILSSLSQIFFKKFFRRKLFPVAPLHMTLKFLGWPEPKIVARFWLAGIIFAAFGLWLSLIN